MVRWIKANAGNIARRVRDGTPVNMLWPLAGLVIVALAGCTVVMASLVAQVDEYASNHKRLVISLALEQQKRDVGEAARAVAHEIGIGQDVHGALNRQSVRPRPRSAVYSYLIDSQGRTEMSVSPTGKRAPDLWRVSPTGMRAIMRAWPRDLSSARKMRSSVVLISRYEETPAILAAMAVMPSSAGKGNRGEGLRYVLMVQKLDDATFSKWEDTFQFSGIAWAKSDLGDSWSGVTLIDAGWGDRMGSITWPAHHIGKRAIGTMTPLLAICFVVFSALSVWLILLIYRSRSALEESSRMAVTLSVEANENAERADRARREAEAALVEAEAARRRADDIARREVAEQASHRQQLRENSHRMAAALQESMASLVKQLLETANDLELSAETTIGTLQEQQRQADVVRGRSRDAAAAIQVVTGGIEELTVSIAEIRKAADQSRQFALEASDRSAAARGANDRLLHQVVSISDAASLIASIAKQTNLLALNAAIEAARAGASGYGFAVVANEVKALASETARTTGSIHDRVGGIETAARSTVELVGSLDEMLGGLVQAMAASSTTVQQQQAVAENIQRSSRGVAENAQVADQAIEAISRSLDSISQTASSTLHIGAAVRNRAEHLNAEFARLVAQLEAA